MDQTLIHASSVAFEGRGIAIIGPSGSGKSALALQLIAFGAELIADDQTQIHRQNGQLLASAPETIGGLIEARGVGLIRLPALSNIPLALIIDMQQEETNRLPERHEHSILGLRLLCLHKVAKPHFAAAIIALMKGYRSDPK